jgi:amidohydrolase
MPIINRIAEFHHDMTQWRHDIHAHPEIAFQERRTADFVAQQLASFGIAVHRGLAGTGVVGTLIGRGKNGGGIAIALRADLDALPMNELNEFAHKSTYDGRMHACGHDGHTTMLLGAARYLAETRNFDGTVHFVFQPAEEAEGGGRLMVEQGLFEKFPVSAVYGMHNWPSLPVGHFAVRSGAMCASLDIFEITVTGKGSHGAMPHQGVDSVLAGSHIVTAFQSIASRNVSPLDSAVVSVTQFHGGDAWAVIPDSVVLRGTTRSFKPAVQDMIEANMRRIAEGIAQTLGARISFRYERRYPPVVNTALETKFAADVAAEIVGDERVDRDVTPTMGSEDFAFMLNEKPGCYIFVGNGAADESQPLHNPGYDFNDEALPFGTSYWVRLVERSLPLSR